MTRAPYLLILLAVAVPALAACGASGRASLGSRAGFAAGLAVAGPPGAAAGSALGAGIGAMTTGAKPVTVLGAAAGGVIGPTGASLGATGGQLVDAQFEKRQLERDRKAAEKRLAAEDEAKGATTAATDASAVGPASGNATTAAWPEPAPLAVPAAPSE